MYTQAMESVDMMETWTRIKGRDARVNDEIMFHGHHYLVIKGATGNRRAHVISDDGHSYAVPLAAPIIRITR